MNLSNIGLRKWILRGDFSRWGPVIFIVVGKLRDIPKNDHQTTVYINSLIPASHERKYTIFEERRSCPTIQLSLGVSGKTLPNMTNMLKVLIGATNLVFSQCLTGLKVCNTNL